LILYCNLFPEEVIDGLDRVVLNMKGEVAVITIPPEYAFGSTQSKQYIAIVPPNSTVVYEVELVSFVKVQLIFICVCSKSLTCVQLQN
jgi:FKBP-type peptidyl-prolyl cis-trans isomerase